MKSKFALFCALIMAVLMCSCGTTSPDSSAVATTPEPSPTPAPIDENLCTLFDESLPYYAYPTFSQAEDGSVIISIKADTDNVSNFGNIIYDSLCSADEIFGDYTVRINFWYGNDIQMYFYGDSSYGTITDRRSGESKDIVVKSAEDIAQLFPVLKTKLNAKANGVTDDELTQYNEIMKALDDSSRSEDDILEEISPAYGMTSEELKAWMNEMMEKMY